MQSLKCFQVDQRWVPSKVEQVAASAAMPRIFALLARDVGQSVLAFHAFAWSCSPVACCDELAQSLLERLVACEVDAAT